MASNEIKSEHVEPIKISQITIKTNGLSMDKIEDALHDAVRLGMKRVREEGIRGIEITAQIDN